MVLGGASLALVHFSGFAGDPPDQIYTPWWTALRNEAFKGLFCC